MGVAGRWVWVLSGGRPYVEGEGRGWGGGGVAVPAEVWSSSNRGAPATLSNIHFL